MAGKYIFLTSLAKSVMPRKALACFAGVFLLAGLVHAQPSDNVKATGQVSISQLANGTVYHVGFRSKTGADSSAYTLFIPSGVDTVRGIFIHQHGCGMEGRGVSTAYDVQYQAFAKKWGLAIVGPDLYYQSGCYEWRDPQSGSGPSLLAALERIGTIAGHPELNEAPWLLWGHSGGGHWVLGMMRDYPERTLAAFCYSPAFDPQWDYPKEALKIPVMIRHAGANDSNSPNGKCWETAVNTFHRLRAAGGLASIAPTPYQNHNYSYVRYMAIPFYESVLKQRLPQGQSVSYRAMKDMDATAGWLGDTARFNTYPHHAVAQSATELSWLPDSATAARWKEYLITGTVVDRTPPPAPYDIVYTRLHNVSIALEWRAWADIESGIKHFNIYNGNQLIARFPEHGVYQRFDTNGDDAIPMSGLPALKAAVFAPVGSESEISISTVNHFDVESPRTKLTRGD